MGAFIFRPFVAYVETQRRSAIEAFLKLPQSTCIEMYLKYRFEKKGSNEDGEDEEPPDNEGTDEDNEESSSSGSGIRLKNTTSSEPAYVRLLANSPEVVKGYIEYANIISGNFSSYREIMSLISTKILYPIIVFCLLVIYVRSFQYILRMVIEENSKTVRLILMMPLTAIAKNDDVKKLLEFGDDMRDIPELNALTGGSEDIRLREIMKGLSKKPDGHRRSSSVPNAKQSNERSGDDIDSNKTPLANTFTIAAIANREGLGQYLAEQAAQSPPPVYASPTAQREEPESYLCQEELLEKGIGIEQGRNAFTGVADAMSAQPSQSDITKEAQKSILAKSKRTSFAGNKDDRFKGKRRGSVGFSQPEPMRDSITQGQASINQDIDDNSNIGPKLVEGPSEYIPHPISSYRLPPISDNIVVDK
ncbi:hypothetical protein HDU67_005034 [Dinochytrium kinnereticum]|nr:hypothetical protein HDU67_005034 [Dinochytrium kinnereticum]